MSETKSMSLEGEKHDQEIIICDSLREKIEQTDNILKTSIYYNNPGYDSANIHNLILKNMISIDAINIICNLILNDIIPIITDDTNILILQAVSAYYDIKKDYDNMIKYLLLAVDRKDIGAINALAMYYESQKDYKNMVKYYLILTEHKNVYAMANLGFYYKQQRNYDQMKKYYLMAIEYKNSIAMNNFGFYYHEQKDYEQMKKYYLMAIDEKDHSAMYNLGFYYSEKKEYEQMKKYYIMASENHPVALVSLFNHYYSSYNEDGLIVLHNLHKKGIPNAYIYFLRLLKVATDTAISSYFNYIKNIDIELDIQKAKIISLNSYITELEFAPDGPKYKETKDHFESISNTKI
jgi:hypothetical protein